MNCNITVQICDYVIILHTIFVEGLSFIIITMNRVNDLTTRGFFFCFVVYAGIHLPRCRIHIVVDSVRVPVARRQRSQQSQPPQSFCRRVCEYNYGIRIRIRKRRTGVFFFLHLGNKNIFFSLYVQILGLIMAAMYLLSSIWGYRSYRGPWTTTRQETNEQCRLAVSVFPIISSENVLTRNEKKKKTKLPLKPAGLLETKY